MTMPRPSGKAQKIAKKTIPGLNRNDKKPFRRKKKIVPNDEVELKIIKINEELGA
jgi:hypothetical protein